MMSKKEKKLLNHLKSKVFKLKENGQIPYSLYINILQLNYESDIDRVQYLSNLSEKYIRIGGFYIKHPEASYECDKELNFKY